MKKSKYLELVVDAIQAVCAIPIDPTDNVNPLAYYVYNKGELHRCLQTDIKVHDDFDKHLYDKLKAYNADVSLFTNNDISIVISQPITYTIAQYETFYNYLGMCDHC